MDRHLGRRCIFSYYIMIVSLGVLFFGTVQKSIAQPRVSIVNQSGKEFSGQFTSLQNDNITITAGSFELKLSIKSLKAIHFVKQRPSTPPQTRTILTRKGKQISFRRLISRKPNTLQYETYSNTVKNIPFDQIQSIYLLGSRPEFQLIYQSETGDSKTIFVSMGDPPKMTLGSDTWVIRRKGNRFGCYRKTRETHSYFPLWSLPPTTGNQWPILNNTEISGLGRWLDKTDDNPELYRFELQLSAMNGKKTNDFDVLGQFDPRTLIPVQFTVQSPRTEQWRLHQKPLKVTLSPCVIPVILHS